MVQPRAWAESSVYRDYWWLEMEDDLEIDPWVVDILNTCKSLVIASPIKKGVTYNDLDPSQRTKMNKIMDLSKVPFRELLNGAKPIIEYLKNQRNTLSWQHFVIVADIQDTIIKMLERCFNISTIGNPKKWAIADWWVYENEPWVFTPRVNTLNRIKDLDSYTDKRLFDLWKRSFKKKGKSYGNSQTWK